MDDEDTTMDVIGIANARAYGLELAAAYHDDMGAQHEESHRESASNFHEQMGESHRRDAKAIRALSRLPPAPSHEMVENNEQVEPVLLGYTNWRGEFAERSITPIRVHFGATDWHPEPQWLIEAFDHDRNANRDFTLKDFGSKGGRLMEKLDLEASLVERLRSAFENVDGGEFGGVIARMNEAADEIERLRGYCQQLLDMLENYDVEIEGEDNDLIAHIRKAVDPAVTATEGRAND